MPRKKTMEERDTALVSIELTPLQQTLITVLLTGRGIGEAALAVGVDRRTVSRWLEDDHPVMAEYTRQRLILLQQSSDRVANLHARAFTALEDALSDEAPLAMRLDVAKFLLNQHPETLSNRAYPGDTLYLLQQERERERNKQFLDMGF